MRKEICTCGAWNTPTSKSCWKCGTRDVEIKIEFLKTAFQPRPFDLFRDLTALHKAYEMMPIARGFERQHLQAYHRAVGELLEGERKHRSDSYHNRPLWW